MTSTTRDLRSSADEMRRGDLWRWSALFAAAGALALGVQTYLLRELLVLLQGDEAAVGLGLAAWLVGIAVGAVAARRRAERSARSVGALALGLLGLLGCAEVPAARFGRSLVAVPTGELLALGPSLLLAVALFTIPGACVGATFVALACSASAKLGNASRAIGRLYVFEALGSLVAGLLTSLVLIPHVESTCGIGLLVVMAILTALPAAFESLISGGKALVLVAAVGLGLGVTPLGGWLARTTEQTRFAGLAVGSPFVAATHTPYQHLAVGGAEQRVLYANGQYVAGFPDPSADELLAHELMLFAERPRRVLSFGGLETGLLRFCLMHPVSRIDIVLIDPDALRFVERYLDPADRAALQDPRVRLIFEDPRQFLGKTANSYDLVLSLEPDPTTLFLARTTSVEFHRLVLARLAPAGAYVTRFTAGANLQSGEIGLLGASLYRTLRAVLPIVRATPGPEAFFVAGRSEQTITLDTTQLERRYRERHVNSEVFVPELLPELLPTERVATLKRELERSSRAIAPARDDRPVSFLYALGLRQRIAGSAWASLLRWATNHPLWVTMMALLPSLLLLLRSLPRRQLTSRIPAWHATAVTGACGLASSLLVFVSFQTRVGALYSELGALNGLFMVGLALGGVTAMRGRRLRPMLWAQGICTALSAILLLALTVIDRIPSVPLLLWPLHVLLLMSAGFGTGLVFPAATRELLSFDAGSDAGGVAASLELLDHAGAAVAALFCAVLLIPTLGLQRTAGLLVAMQVLALLVSSKSPGSRDCSSGICLP
jgi:predicted membrane-bound spermidine synthase